MNLPDLTAGLVSVVVPAYNRGHLIGRAIKSIMNQAYDSWEIVVGDDGSTDNTLEVLNEFGLGDRLRYFRHDSNRGPSAARNTALREAKGEFIAFLDSDDEWLEDKLQAQVSWLRSDPGAVAVLCGVEQRNGIETETVLYLPSTELVADMTEPIMNRAVGPYAGTSVVARHEFLLQNEILWDERLFTLEDWDFVANIARHGRVGSLPSVLEIKYRHGEGHAWAPDKVVRSVPTLLEKYQQEFRSRKRARAAVCALMAVNLERLGDKSAARGYWLKAMRARPAALGYVRRFALTLL